MKLNYLDRKWYYKPEYSLDDFIRVNELDGVAIDKVCKIMVKLYALALDADYPWHFNPYNVLEPNLNNDENN